MTQQTKEIEVEIDESTVIETHPGVDKLKNLINQPLIDDEAKEPTLYDVILHNDDFTPEWTVRDILSKIFGLNEREARTVMMKAHVEGTAFVNKFTREMAETKVSEAKELSRGYPLTFTFEKE